MSATSWNACAVMSLVHRYPLGFRQYSVCFAYIQPSDYLVIDRRGPGNDTLEQHLETQLFIENL